jgi:hypothetical protein
MPFCPPHIQNVQIRDPTIADGNYITMVTAGVQTVKEKTEHW